MRYYRDHRLKWQGSDDEVKSNIGIPFSLEAGNLYTF